nr:sigma 54-interacting transcriptional regulator [uncultured Holophaga sp.]
MKVPVQTDWIRTRGEFSAIAFLESLLAEAAPKWTEGLQRSLAEIRTLADFSVLADYLHDGVQILDGQGRLTYVNEPFVRLTGIAREECIGKGALALVKGGLLSDAAVPGVLKSRAKGNAMVDCPRTGRKLLSTANPIFDPSGAIEAVVVVDRDMTELASVKAELEANNRKKALMLDHLKRSHQSQGFIGESAPVREMLRLVQQVAPLDATVLITGETGTGKEVIANAIYTQSRRQDGPFIKVNCAAIPANLLEAELFGYEKGAFTGAVSTGRIGLFELADKGALLLDEIGEMPLELQPKLLRALQDREITRVGGGRPIKLDVRLLAATHCQLLELVRQGRFREDLYYRLAVFPIQIPPLRSREGDVELLVRHFLETYGAKYGKELSLSEGGMALLRAYGWPGNVRELINVVERLVIVGEGGSTVEEERIRALVDVGGGRVEASKGGLRASLDLLEGELLRQALAKGGSTRAAAELLDIDQASVVRKARKHGIRLKPH